MSTRMTRGTHLVTGLAVGLLAVPVLGGLLWGMWRLLFWSVVAAAPHAQYGHPSRVAMPGAMPMATEAISVGLVGSGSTLPLFALSVLLALVVLVVAVLVGETAEAGDRDGSVTALERADECGEGENDRFGGRRVHPDDGRTA